MFSLAIFLVFEMYQDSKDCGFWGMNVGQNNYYNIMVEEEIYILMVAIEQVSVWRLVLLIT